MQLEQSLLDEKVLRARARKVLKSYRKICLISGATFDVRSVPLSEMPKGERNNNGLSDCIIKRLDAEREAFAIIEAWQRLDERSRTVVYYAYLAKERFTVRDIALKMVYCERSISRIKDMACIDFACAYKNGVLLE
jgi:ArpU family phage transcriptional regulator